ncbi:hypothetical protein RRG08_057562 [Elysia crispata]|uniref:Uncharacterized protein n=1 Tax=Elysia crispata TaxID=231223 RepID=A0AAE0Z9Z7_9GAST|nr:hypothetical protein RRG08_057562 [Elysia crispata]
MLYSLTPHSSAPTKYALFLGPSLTAPLLQNMLCIPWTFSQLQGYKICSIPWTSHCSLAATKYSAPTKYALFLDLTPLRASHASVTCRVFGLTQPATKYAHFWTSHSSAATAICSISWTSLTAPLPSSNMLYFLTSLTAPLPQQYALFLDPLTAPLLQNMLYSLDLSHSSALQNMLYFLVLFTALPTLQNMLYSLDLTHSSAPTKYALFLDSHTACLHIFHSLTLSQLRCLLQNMLYSGPHTACSYKICSIPWTSHSPRSCQNMLYSLTSHSSALTKYYALFLGLSHSSAPYKNMPLFLGPLTQLRSYKICSIP